jgi:hypothetical protein
MERLYRHRPYMQEGMYVVGVRPKSLGEGVVAVVYTVDYAKAWQFWDDNFQMNYGIYQWSRGGFICVGRKMKHRLGHTIWVPVPPDRMKTA